MSISYGPEMIKMWIVGVTMIFGGLVIGFLVGYGIALERGARALTRLRRLR